MEISFIYHSAEQTNLMTIIPIAPYTMGSPAAPKVGVLFEVRYIQYTSPTAVADCHLLDAEGVATVAINSNDIERFPAECVNPPADMKAEDWIKSGFKGAKC